MNEEVIKSVDVEDLNEEEKDIFERIYSHFESMTINEQKTLLKMLIFEYLECVRKSKGKNKRNWQVQAQTYEFLISLFTNSIIDSRSFVFKQVEKDYKRMFEISIKA